MTCEVTAFGYSIISGSLTSLMCYDLSGSLQKLCAHSRIYARERWAARKLGVKPRMCVYISVYVYIYIYIYIHTYIHIYTHILYIYIYVLHREREGYTIIHNVVLCYIT